MAAATNISPTSCRDVQSDNQMNNFIAKMDTVSKIEKYVTYQETPLRSFQEHVENTYAKAIERLENGTYTDFTLNEKEILGIIDNLTTFIDVHTLNVVHDTVSDHLNCLSQVSGYHCSLMPG